jgi:hypothetical protein
MQGESPGRARSFGRLLEGENPLFISLDNDYIPSLSTSGEAVKGLPQKIFVNSFLGSIFSFLLLSQGSRLQSLLLAIIFIFKK